LRERSTDQKAGAAARGRGLAGVIASSAECVVWWSTVEKFAGGNDGFNPVFSETEEVRVKYVSK